MDRIAVDTKHCCCSTAGSIGYSLLLVI